tara:strand:- start:634 stop:1749 length:1116 start_codon:yes stop_codon:yes gene_type:complete
MNLHDLPTPTLILDRRRVRANTDEMRVRIHAHGVALRPHAKTAKSVDVARMAVGDRGNALAVSTLREADYFLNKGFTDLVYAVCITPDKLDVVAALVERGAELKIITDNLAVAEAISNHPGTHRVLIEIDCGEHRTGVAADSPNLTEMAEAVERSGRSKILGVLTHAGHSYSTRTPDAAAVVAEAERVAAVTAGERLREAGFETPIISVGSTPTATHGVTFDGVTEVRPGVYVFQDMFQVGIGSCSINALALSVLASVIANNRDRGTLMLDAGGLALSKDRSTSNSDFDAGFGQIADLSGAILPGLRVNSVHQEHGEVLVEDPALFAKLTVGTKVRVFPNHACMTAAAYEVYNVIDGGFEVVDQWERCNGW